LDACFHCGLPAVSGLHANIGGQRREFCCIGCQAVAQAIAGQGLADFYRFREQLNARPQAVETRFDAYDLPEVQEDFVERAADGSATVNLFVSGISCAACVWLIEKHLLTQPGVQQVQVNASTHRARIRLQSDMMQISDLFQALTHIGFQPQPLVGRAEQELWQRDQRDYLLRMAIAGIGMMQAGMVAVALHAGDLQGIDPHWEQVLRWVNLLLTLPIMVFSAKPFFIGAWRALRLGRLVNDVSISLALILAFGASVYATVTHSGDVYFDSVAMFAFFLLLGRYLEKRARYANFKASARFHNLLPMTVNRLRPDGSVETIPFKQLLPGEQVVVAPGAAFPCDGEVLDGQGEVDESLMTGEATPRPKSPGDPVYAGTFNGGTPLRVRADCIGASTQLAAIEQLVQQAEQERPRQVTLADRIASRFVGGVLTVATLVGVGWYWIDPAKAFWVSLSVLVVSCPCALSLATPTVLTVAVGYMRRCGVLVTGGQVFENLHGVNHVVFDKTGTLTDGALRIVETRCLTDLGKAEVLALAGALESGSSHPIARAFADFGQALPVQQRRSVAGEGVGGRIHGTEYRLGTPAYVLPHQSPSYPDEGLWLLLADETRALAWIRLEDRLRDSAEACIGALRDLGCEPILLSGDRAENVARVAATLGIAQWRGGLLPDDKLAFVRGLQGRGGRVLMVGDGINDLPVLGGADVSCAMGSATRLAQTRADCILLGEDLRQIPVALAFARRVRSVIKQNLTWAIVYNVCALPLAAAGLVPPWLAAIGMSSSSLVVVVNSLRVGRARP
jgi:Cu2+-exporting ATPase